MNNPPLYEALVATHGDPLDTPRRSHRQFMDDNAHDVWITDVLAPTTKRRKRGKR